MRRLCFLFFLSNTVLSALELVCSLDKQLGRLLQSRAVVAKELEHAALLLLVGLGNEAFSLCFRHSSLFQLWPPF